jgi:branched-chain amino acid aminotransferase
MTETQTIEVTKVTSSKIHGVDMNNPVFGLNYSDHMFMADFKGDEWENSRITPYGNLSISPANAALHYAQSIFEGLKAHRAENGDVLIFRPLDNAKRLAKSAIRMCMPPVPEELFMDAVTQLVKLDQQWVPSVEGSSLYIRPFEFATDPFIGVRASKEYLFMVITGPVGAYYTEPVKVKIEKHFTRAVAGGVGAAKTAGNYAASLYPAKMAQEKGYHQLVWTDGISHQYIEESGTMNIMFVIDGKLVTPQLNDSILPGITRDSALTLARSWGMAVEERKVSVDEVITAASNGKLEEAFGIGTAATISHIRTIGYEGTDFDLPKVTNGEISNRIKKELTDIKYGRAEDKFGWIHRV